MTNVTAATETRQSLRQPHLYPGQFRLLVGGTFFGLVVIGLAFPYTAILIRERLGVSMAVVGVIIGGRLLSRSPLVDSW